MQCGALGPWITGNCSGEAGEAQMKAAARGCTSRVLTDYSLLLFCNPFSCCFQNHPSKAQIWPLCLPLITVLWPPLPLRVKTNLLRVCLQLSSLASPLASPPYLLDLAPALLNLQLFSENTRPSPPSGPLLDTCPVNSRPPGLQLEL